LQNRTDFQHQILLARRPQLQLRVEARQARDRKSCTRLQRSVRVPNPCRVGKDLFRYHAAADKVLQVGELADEAAQAPHRGRAQRCAVVP
jgi:hypothetical protein